MHFLDRLFLLSHPPPYICSIQNSGGTTTHTSSPSLALFHHYAIVIQYIVQIHKQQQEQPLKHPSTVLITCTHTTSTPTPSSVWKKNFATYISAEGFFASVITGDYINIYIYMQVIVIPPRGAPRNRFDAGPSASRNNFIGMALCYSVNALVG